MRHIAIERASVGLGCFASIVVALVLFLAPLALGEGALPFAVPPWLLRGELDFDEFPDDLSPALQHLVQHGFSILNVQDGSHA